MSDISVRKRGEKWYYSFEAASIDGKRKRIERVGGKTKKEALEKGITALAEYNGSGIMFDHSNISVSDYLDYWYENYVKINCKDNTQRGYGNIIRIHLKPYIGMYKLSSITPTTLQSHVNKLYAIGLSKNYLSSILGVITSSFKYAVYPANLIKSNPAEYISLPKCTSKKGDTNRRVISNDEFKRIIERFPVNTKYYIMLMICYYTGTRIAECSGLTWDRIDLDKKTISIDRILVKHADKKWYVGSPKTLTSTRTIPIGDTLINALKNHRKWQLENRMKYSKYYNNYYISKDNRIYALDNQLEYAITDNELYFVCTQEDGTVINPDLSRYCSRVINYDLGIQFNFHSLRHTHATILIENGANMKDVQERLGHAQLSTTMDTYTHVTEKMSKETVSILEKAVGLPT